MEVCESCPIEGSSVELMFDVKIGIEGSLKQFRRLGMLVC